ncbi:Hypothetical predicted protein [Mytilus galloprovincialis]|uniref:Uncharacterized protein n=1 Tax=Mytilus galloprovincialis TaxID=29158 RepID=A0A8B6CAB3_MYTGA|nr:Hypothetical predicted protein [Mytilus galloprovincialis]
MKHLLLLSAVAILTECRRVNICPTGQERLNVKNELCDDPALYHCIPDSNCDLHEICIYPNVTLQIQILTIQNESLYWKHVATAPITNTELYGNLALFLCQYSMGNYLNDTTFVDVQTRLNITIQYQHSFRTKCLFPYDEHILPASGSCTINNKCLKTEKVADIKLFILYNGILLLKEYTMGWSNNSNYYKLAFLLCELANYEFDDNRPYQETKIRIGNSGTEVGFSLYGIIAGFTVPVFIAAVLTLLYVHNNCKGILKRKKITSTETTITTGAQIEPLLQETSHNSNI